MNIMRYLLMKEIIVMTLENIKVEGIYLIMQELCNFNLKINVIRNGLEKYLSFSINKKSLDI